MTSSDFDSPGSGSLHSLLLLSDSALPLGSFAFSSGLESFLAHTKDATLASHKVSSPVKLQAFNTFLEHSIHNVASTALPYVLRAYNDPTRDVLEDLDNDFDASTPCTVARRASITQGRALLTVWERALSPTASNISNSAAQALTVFSASLKTNKPDANGLSLNAHFGPLFGFVCRALDISIEQTAYLFLLNHAKAVLSAAVRASVIGPYQSWANVGSAEVQGWIKQSVKLCKHRKVEDAAVTVPVMDLWMGRHELLYSRIFNS
jgi:urease accessory protein